MSKASLSGFISLALTLLLNIEMADAQAPAVRITGSAGIEYRYFLQSPRFPGQDTGGTWSFYLRPEFSWQNAARDFQARMVLFAREDSVDRERDHQDLREAYLRWSGTTYRFLAGIQQEFWGVTESRHLVDIINQTDLVEDPDGEQKLGQPMLQFSGVHDWGEWSLFLLPYFRERTFAGTNGRLRPALAVDESSARYESGRGRHRWDLALRYAHAMGDWDIGLHLFDGTSREPRLGLEGSRLIPVYDLMRQIGLDLQYTREATLYKFEVLGRRSRGEDFVAAVAGLEYTLFSFAGTDGDLGLLAEYLYDARSSRQPETPFDNDVFLGTRWTMNDPQDTSVLFGITLDHHTGATFYNLEADRRIGQSLKLGIRARFIANTPQDDPLYSLQRDDYLQLELSYHF